MVFFNPPTTKMILKIRSPIEFFVLFWELLFVSWDVLFGSFLSHGTFCFGSFLSLETFSFWELFVPWDVLFWEFFCPMGRFVFGAFCPMGRLVLGAFCCIVGLRALLQCSRPANSLVIHILTVYCRDVRIC